ncbi:MAG: hypothetical protein OEV78_07685 [Spirochaetia bacterium]|nr:hypothetical protein [Spirochaetia bacterium]
MIRNLSTSLLILGFSFVVVFYYPHTFLSPGSVQSHHKKLEDQCSKCHAGLSGVPNSKCISCHSLSSIGGNKIFQSSETRVKIPVKLLHEDIRSATCYSCHPEHLSSQMIRKGKFTHDLFDTQNKCQNCHMKPDDKLHKQFKTCNSCHNSTNWKSVQFDHNKYFQFSSVHPDKCQNCHNGQDYTEYTCYNCHEHSQSGIKRLHMNLGLKTFDNCVQCHRSANEREAWQHMPKSEYRNADSTTGATPRSGKYRRKNSDHDEHEHEDDDDD